MSLVLHCCFASHLRPGFFILKNLFKCKFSRGKEVGPDSGRNLVTGASGFQPYARLYEQERE
jgi:hypothetical protein